MQAASVPLMEAAESVAPQIRRARRVDPALLGSVGALLLTGLLVSFSASSRIGANMAGDVTYFLKRQIVWILIGLLAAA